MMSRVYPITVGEPQSSAFQVAVDGASVPILLARVSSVPFNRRWPGHQRPLDQTELATFALFETDGPAEIAVRPLRAFEKVMVRPLSRGVRPVVEEGVIRFTIPGPGQYTVELDGYHEALHLFADPVRQYEVNQDDPDVIYYGCGLHDVGLIELKPGQTLFIDEGAVVFARVYARDADNIRILGHGILDGSRNVEKFLFEFGEKEWEQFNKGFAVTNVERKHTVQLEFCDHVQIDGITIRDSLVYNIRPVACRDLTIENVKIIGNWRYNSDGIDMHNCEQVRIRNCFVRTYDDSICIKGFDYEQNEADMLHDGYLHNRFTDVLVENCVIWCDWGRSLEFGAETRAQEIADVTFRNCDLIHNSSVACDVQNVDYAEIHDVLFEDIRVEYDDVSQQPRIQQKDSDAYLEDPASTWMPGLLGAYVTYVPEYSKGDMKRGVNRSITFRNIRVSAPRMPESGFAGYDAQHESRDILIDGLYLNGERITSLEQAHVKMGPFVSNVRLI